MQSLSVTILDKELKIVRRSFYGNDVIGDVPLHKTVGEVLAYVSVHFFKPPLGYLEPYQNEGKQGVGEPLAIAPETTIATMKKRQKHRHVGLDRLKITGMADLGLYNVILLPLHVPSLMPVNVLSLPWSLLH